MSDFNVWDYYVMRPEALRLPARLVVDGIGETCGYRPGTCDGTDKLRLPTVEGILGWMQGDASPPGNVCTTTPPPQPPPPPPKGLDLLGLVQHLRAQEVAWARYQLALHLHCLLGCLTGRHAGRCVRAEDWLADGCGDPGCGCGDGPCSQPMVCGCGFGPILYRRKLTGRWRCDDGKVGL